MLEFMAVFKPCDLGEEIMIGNPECLSTNHVFHICSLKACGLNDQNSETFCGLHHKPGFRCEKCGAESEEAFNLCDPQKLNNM